MFVTVFPAVNEDIGSWFEGLDPLLEGKWLVQQGSLVSVGQPIYSVTYEDYFRSEGRRILDSVVGRSREVRVVLKSPLKGKISPYEFYSYSAMKYRDYSKDPNFTCAEDIQKWGAILSIESEQRYSPKAISLYQPWFDAVEENLSFLERVLRKSSRFSEKTQLYGKPEREWVDLLARERKFFISQQCPSFTKQEFDRINNLPPF